MKWGSGVNFAEFNTRTRPGANCLAGKAIIAICESLLPLQDQREIQLEGPDDVQLLARDISR
jgi:hypothetical protein